MKSSITNQLNNCSEQFARDEIYLLSKDMTEANIYIAKRKTFLILTTAILGCQKEDQFVIIQLQLSSNKLNNFLISDSYPIRIVQFEQIQFNKR
jgi:hypothetical protein